MVKASRCFRFLFTLVLLATIVVRAKDIADYNVGDAAEEDITTPVAFDAVDPEATAAKKNAEAARTPVIFRWCPSMTNDVVNNFLNLFDETHKNFLATLDKKFHAPTLDDTTIASPDFHSVLVSFNKKNKAFPLTTNLANVWARGDSDAEIKAAFMARLGEGLRRPIAPEELPDRVKLGETVRIVTVKNLADPLTLAEAQRRGKIGGLEYFRKLSSAHSIFRRQFPADEQTTARGLMTIIQPDCIVDEQLTEQSREAATASISVLAHYDAGQVIVHHGETIDAKIKSALDALKDNAAAIQMLARAKQAQQQAQLEQARAKQMAEQALQQKQDAVDVAQRARKHEAALFAEIGGVAVFAILAVVVVFYLAKAKQPAIPVPANGKPARIEPTPVVAEKPAPATSLKINISTPAVPAASPVRLTAVAEPQTMQEKAEAEILQLSQRLDKIFAPPYDRLRTYQLRLEDFQRELEQQHVENPELLKLKMAVLQRQMEIERKRFRL